jgi:thiol-disulfide isomerase/thioredoxin
MILKLFRADWCHACHTALPAARDIADALSLPLEAVDVDTDEGRAAQAEAGVRALPTLALVDGARVRFRVSGPMIDLAVVTRLASALSAAAATTA